MPSLKLYEIFPSIDGEQNQFGQGAMTTFIRLGGCNCACSYCDTPATQPLHSGDYIMSSIDDVLDEVAKLGLNKVTITGGEPLLQEEALLYLCRRLIERKYMVTIETNGTILPSPEFIMGDMDMPCPVLFVVDRKCPSSGVTSMMPEPLIPWFAAFSGPRRPVFVKYVIANKIDFDWAAADIVRLNDTYASLDALGCTFPPPTILLSPVAGVQSVMHLFEWARAAKLVGCLFNIQTHKLVNMR